jgi:hypothetical protein
VRTPLGGYIIFDYRHCPLAREGAEIPREYHKESGEGKRPFFFCPVEGCGTVLGQLRGFPLAYSPGFATEIEARTAAIEWETRGKAQSDTYNRDAYHEMDKLFEDFDLDELS